MINAKYTLYTIERSVSGVNGIYEVGGGNAANEITDYVFGPFE